MKHDPRLQIKDSFFSAKRANDCIEDLAIIFITTEGIQHQSGGIARYTKHFIETMVELRKPLEQVGVKLTLYAAEPALLRVVPTYNQKNFQYMKSLLESTGGGFYKLINNTYGEDWIHNVENWKLLSSSAATIALNLAEKHQAALVFFGSSCLALTQVYIHKQIKAFNADVKTIYMTHDSAFSSFWEERNENVLSMDYLCAQWTNLTPNAKIGYVSQYMKQLFTEKYMVEESAFVPTRGGVLFGEERFQSLNSEQIKGILQKYDIPLDKKLLFSWGRPVDYKRMDLIFSVSKHLSDDFFPVAVTNGSFPSLRHFINHHNLPGKLIENYKQFELIQALLQWSGTVTACLLSENEPGAIVPMEAMYLADNTGPIIIGNQNGIYNELIQDGVDGFLIENNLPKLAERIQQISQMSPAQLQQLRTNAYLKIVNFYDQKKNYIETLIHCIPQLKIHYEKLISLVK